MTEHIDWNRFVDLYREGDVARGRIIQQVRGGLIVDVGVRAFLPASQIDVPRPVDIGTWVGRHVEGLILRIAMERRVVIFSRRRLLESHAGDERASPA